MKKEIDSEVENGTTNINKQKPQKCPKQVGVYFILKKFVNNRGETVNDEEYIITYRVNGKGNVKRDPVGRKSEGMNPRLAAIERAKRMSGEALPNKEKREQEKLEKLKGGADEIVTLETLWKAYLEINNKPSILRGNLTSWNLLKNYHSKPANDFTTIDIDKLRKKLENTKSQRSEGYLSAKTVHNALELLKRLLKWGEERGMNETQRALKFNMPLVDNEKTEMLTDEQIKRLIAVLDAEKDQNTASLIRIAMLTGMRRGALFGLKWSDIDFDKQLVKLRGVEAKKGTTDNIPISQSVVNIFKSIQRDELSEYVWPGKNGEKRSECNMPAKVRDLAGLPKDFRPLHGLRHNFASKLVSAGIDLYTVSKTLTHNSTSQTKRYAHLSDEVLRNAVNKAESLIKKENKEDN